MMVLLIKNTPSLVMPPPLLSLMVLLVTVNLPSRLLKMRRR
jgi:hypothetical protein